MSIRFSKGLAAASLAVAAATAACGGPTPKPSSGNGVASKSAAQIVSSARASAQKASSVHYQGVVAPTGLKLGVDMNAASRVGEGTLKVAGSTAQVRRVGSATYLKAGSAFFVKLAHTASLQASVLANKWIEVPPSISNSSGVRTLTNIHALFSKALSFRSKDLVKSGTTTVDGKKVVAIKEPARHSVLYVATTGTPYPVEVSKGPAGSISFSGWNRKLHVSVPSKVTKLG